jgi:hypothetical protein
VIINITVTRKKTGAFSVRCEHPEFEASSMNRTRALNFVKGAVLSSTLKDVPDYEDVPNTIEFVITETEEGS